MYFSTIVLSTLLATLSSATIILGHADYENDGHKDTAVWIQGQDPCAYTYMGHGSPCSFNGGNFVASNTFHYRIVNCNNGQPFTLQNENGSKNAEAVFRPIDDLVHCPGGYTMGQTWVF
ncbi:hypothetical protein GGP41_008952 [Bipolaris sorokiniana]|uniref:AA1-like domain-containing protein n=2 Tax=Cochliobolus sativus TaxID=45130 RepID=A0A8H5ZCF5_COCSA|nr:uncharacterized protein COCSADRAFT_40391 [Bipolaris sorokiniana ND90Pr]EMD59924.1 hypothetical protein COCSADRAFT_40391 [Bipolaris sorokiniana ND90Pr]KAF5847691.1 hypothetical protein GGP41_008952 [Bipolaris sorokiniana]